MIITRTSIPDVLLLQSQTFNDERGWFMESFRLKDLEMAVGHALHFCQDNQAFSKQGVIRGLHYQLPPFTQSKLVRVIIGKVLDVAVDLRKDSQTFGQHIAQELSAENQLQLFIPRGFAHGYVTLSETSVFVYKVDNYYHKESERSIVVDDPTLGIDWLLPKEEWILSEKDQNLPQFKNALLFDSHTRLYE